MRKIGVRKRKFNIYISSSAIAIAIAALSFALSNTGYFLTDNSIFFTISSTVTSNVGIEILLIACSNVGACPLAAILTDRKSVV